TGSNVAQGQVIGYVGATGLATGPHLHYEFQVNGRHVDPLSVKLPASDPIAKSERTKFMALSEQMMASLDQQGATQLAQLADGVKHLYVGIMSGTSLEGIGIARTSCSPPAPRAPR